MTATTIAIEQLLAGVLALVAFALPFLDIDAIIAVGNSTAGIVVLGVAYLLGVVVDKSSDSIVGGLERWFLWHFVSKHKDFRQDRREAALRHTGGDANENWMNSLRTRIRIARTIGVLVPVVAVSVTLWMVRGLRCGAEAAQLVPAWLEERSQCLDQIGAWAFVPLLIYLASFLLSIAIRLPTSQSTRSPVDSGSRDAWIAWFLLAATPPGVLLCSSAVAIGILLADIPRSLNAWLLASVPLIVAMGALWTWQRVLLTFRSFLAQRPSRPGKADSATHTPS